MKTVKVLTLCGEGINCERETAKAFEYVGAAAQIAPLRAWIEHPELLETADILAFPGGFSYGDELHSGQILAMQLRYHLGDALQRFMKRGGLMLGVCNGFQALMKLGVFEEKSESRKLTLAPNRQHQFLDRWVTCLVPPSKCLWTKNMPASLDMPMRHGEGRIWCQGDEKVRQDWLKKLEHNQQVALRYSEDVNGSLGRIAGLTDSTGRILGLMPHPEAALNDWLYPLDVQRETRAMQIFENAVNYVREQV